MNLILFDPNELDANRCLVLTDRRAGHILQVLRPDIGVEFKIGAVNGKLGQGKVMSMTRESVTLAVSLDREPIPPWIDLLLALPRPKVLRRLLPQLAAMGVGRIILINAARVERCYFATHWLSPVHYTPLLREGLEQAGTTILPEVWIKRRFKAFVNNELPEGYPGHAKWLAHPHPNPQAAVSNLPCDDRTKRPLLAIGPEGGWVFNELRMLESKGFQPISLGGRVLRTDTACLALLGKLMPPCP